jgi:hypothetical protein
MTMYKVKKIRSLIIEQIKNRNNQFYNPQLYSELHGMQPSFSTLLMYDPTTIINPISTLNLNKVSFDDVALA